MGDPMNFKKFESATRLIYAMNSPTFPNRRWRPRLETASVALSIAPLMRQVTP